MTEGLRGDVDLVEGERLAAVASLWRKTGRDLRARFGGSSMEPALPPGTEVLLRCGETGAPGDVIAFVTGGRLMVHRVVARAPDGAWTLTRGDARVLPDAPIRDPDNILGRVVGLWHAGSLDRIPAPAETLSRRGVASAACAVLRLSPRAGAAALRSAHALGRLARSAALVLGRRRGGAS